MQVDDREVKEHIEHKRITDEQELSTMLGLDINVERMDGADYAFLDAKDNPIGIERCEIGNFIQKLRSGELESQLTKCEEMYSILYLLIEGVFDSTGGFLSTHKQYKDGYYRTHIFPNTRYDFILSTLIRLEFMGISIIYSPNFDCSMQVVKAIYNQRMKTDDQHTLFKKIRSIKIPVKMSDNPAVPKLMALGKRFPEKVAIRLISKFGSIWAILNASDKELLEVEGMGKGLLASLKEGVGK